MKRSVHLAHPSHAKQPGDFIRPQACAALQCHESCDYAIRFGLRRAPRVQTLSGGPVEPPSPKPAHWSHPCEFDFDFLKAAGGRTPERPGAPPWTITTCPDIRDRGTSFWFAHHVEAARRDGPSRTGVKLCSQGAIGPTRDAGAFNTAPLRHDPGTWASR